jgi:maltose phosphorylase
MEIDELGVIDYSVELLSGAAEIVFKPYLDSGISNTDANWEEKFWKTKDVKTDGHQGFITSKNS